MVDSLTTSAQRSYSKGGEIFMVEPGNGENLSEHPSRRGMPMEPWIGPMDRRPKQPRAGGAGGGGELPGPPTTPREEPNDQKEDHSQKRKPPEPTDEKAGHPPPIPVAGGQEAGAEGAPRRPIFAEVAVPRFEEELQKEQGRLERELTEGEIVAIRTRIEHLRSSREAIERAERDQALNIEEQYNSLNEAIRRGDISAVDANPYLVRLAQRGVEQRRAEQLIRQGVDPRVEQIRTTQDPQEKRRLDNELIDELDPDSTRPISIEEFRVIAEDQEASERFLDKIISRPLATPRTAYTLSFYAGINLQTFLTEVRRADQGNLVRYTRYGELYETTLRFHEMGRIVQFESGNIDAFINTTRTMTLGYLQIATTLEGVGRVRRLIDEAYGRFYTKKTLIGEKDSDPEINNWVRREFRKLADGGIVKSHFFGPDGNPRNLEDWEIDRALAFGRNTHASFYRQSVLISWSKVPHAYQEWLKGVATETVVKILAGIKWQSYRFRIGATGGGTDLVGLFYDKMEKRYRDNKLTLQKIGKLEILKDIIPTGVFRGDGFDSGWRVLQAYLSSDIMKIKMPDPDSYRSRLVQTAISEFMTEERVAVGDNVNLGKFLIWQEQKAREMFSAEVRVAGVSMPVELRPSDDPKIDKQMREIIEPLIDANPQLNLCLGILIKYYSSNEMVGLRESLWRKTADFLPLRIAYMLSEEGVKDLPGYEALKGKEDNLFSEEFESKLIKAQELRIERQKENTTIGVSLDTFLDEVGMTPQEKQFIDELRRLVKTEKNEAGEITRKGLDLELAKIIFPHIPFLDDVPFENANFLNLESPEVFRRRMGDDFKGFNDAHNAYNTLIDNLDKPYSEILKYLRGIVDGMKSPEGGLTAQNVVLPILQSYLELAEQWIWTRWIPFAKTTRGFLNLPSSWLQAKFGKDAIAADESTMNQMINQAVGIGTIRREKLPGEDKSQFDEAAEHVGARPINVAIDQARTLSVIIAFIVVGSFLSRLTKEKV